MFKRVRNRRETELKKKEDVSSPATTATTATGGGAKSASARKATSGSATPPGGNLVKGRTQSVGVANKARGETSVPERKPTFVPTVKPTLSLSIDPKAPAPMRPGEDLFTANLASAITGKSGSLSSTSSGSPTLPRLTSSGNHSISQRPSDAIPPRYTVSIVVPSGSKVDLKCNIGDTASDFIRQSFNRLKSLLGSAHAPSNFVLTTPNGQVIPSDSLVALDPYVEQCLHTNDQPILHISLRSTIPSSKIGQTAAIPRATILPTVARTASSTSSSLEPVISTSPKFDSSPVSSSGSYGAPDSPRFGQASASDSDLSSSPRRIASQADLFRLNVSHSAGVKSVDCNITDTMHDIMKKLDLSVAGHQLSTPSSVLIDEGIRIASVDYIIECRKHGLTPSLRVVKALSQEQVKEDKELSWLIGHTLCSNDPQDETVAFRKLIHRVRNGVIGAEEKRGYDDEELVVRLSGSPTVTVDRLLIRVILPLEHTTTGLLLVNECGMETADTFLKRLLHMPLVAGSEFYNIQTLPHLLFRPKGARVHIIGRYPLLSFAYIQDCMERKKWPKLVLMTRSKDYIAKSSQTAQAEPLSPGSGWRSARAPRESRPNLGLSFSPRSLRVDERSNEQELRVRSKTSPRDCVLGTPMVEIDPEKAGWPEDAGGENGIDTTPIPPRYNHKVIADPELRWDKKSYISLWELDSRVFRVRVLGVERINELGCPSWKKFSPDQHPDDALGSLLVRVGIYYGGEPLVKKKMTDAAPCSTNPRWSEWLTFDDLQFSNVPREARLCFTLYAKPVRDSDAPVPLAWANFNIFNYKHELQSGNHTLLMWPDGPANPIGTCVGNVGFLHAAELSIELDTFPLPVIFPTDGTTDKRKGPDRNSCVVLMGGQEELEVVEEVETVLTMDSLHRLTPNQKKAVNTLRGYCLARPKALPKFLQAVNYTDHVSVQEMHSLLAFFRPPTPVEALELLDSKFPDAKVREYAVQCIESFSNEELLDYLLQLVQVIKHEPYHDSGNALFWYLRSEMHVVEISERFSLILEAYLRGCPAQRHRLSLQVQALEAIHNVGTRIKDETIKTEEERVEVLNSALRELKLPATFDLPLRPGMKVGELVLDKCKYMDSKKLPLWLVFQNANRAQPPIYAIFKCGDDLRQDMLTLQMLRLMDKMWKNEGFDFSVTPYSCIATGADMGFIEVVPNAATTAAIAKESGYGARGAFKEDPLKNWLVKHNPNKEQWDQALRNFIRSCAGYCVATYVLGIGDRHNDNVMVTKDGRLFHIDFGHFLGNFKKKFGIKRERAPFVLTPDYAYVMGGRDSEGFQLFVTTACRAYNILRKHAYVFINLFAMMLSTGIPELKRPQDLEYLRYAFATDLDDNAAAARFTELIHAALDCWTTRFNNAIHLIVHGNKNKSD